MGGIKPGEKKGTRIVKKQIEFAPGRDKAIDLFAIKNEGLQIYPKRCKSCKENEKKAMIEGLKGKNAM